MTPDTDPRKERIARNEVRFRELNEALGEEVHRALAGGVEKSGFVCECAHTDCDVIVSVELGRYEALRRDPMQFLLVPGHEIPDAEDVVDRGDGYVVVRKHPEVGHVVGPGVPGDS